MSRYKSNNTAGIDQSQFRKEFRGLWDPLDALERPPSVTEVGKYFMSQNKEIEIKERLVAGDRSSGFVEPQWIPSTFRSKDFIKHLLPVYYESASDDIPRLFTDPDDVYPELVYAQVRKSKFWKLLSGPSSDPDEITQETATTVTRQTSTTESMQTKLTASQSGAFQGATSSLTEEVTNTESYTESFSEGVTQRIQTKRDAGRIVTWYALVERYEIKLDAMASYKLEDTMRKISFSNPKVEQRASERANKNKNIIVFKKRTSPSPSALTDIKFSVWANTPSHKKENDEYMEWDVAGSGDHWDLLHNMWNRDFDVDTYGYYSLDRIFSYDVWLEEAIADSVSQEEYDEATKEREEKDKSQE
ncbi:MAG: hypothetical protein AAFN81_05455 [Bacteroidota bacterium]